MNAHKVEAEVYRRKLLAYLLGRNRGPPGSAHRSGIRAQKGGLAIAAIARLHEETLVSDVLPAQSRKRHAEIIRRSAVFFALAMTSANLRHGQRIDIVGRLKRSIELLSRRTVALAHANRTLNCEIEQRKEAEKTLRQSERRYSALLRRSELLQDQLRNMSRQMLTAQEEERRHISRELHDLIAQTLSGIGLRLATLKKESNLNAGTLDRNIARTQVLVIQAVDIVHKFARELRPAVLDDLGLVPALKAFVGPLGRRAGFKAKITVCDQAENLGIEQRTVFFRVAQEALNNVAKHADATRVNIAIRCAGKVISLVIHDNGSSFDVARHMMSANQKRLGLLGMRERMEMVDGTFGVASAPGEGTTITATLPCSKAGSGRANQREKGHTK